MLARNTVCSRSPWVRYGESPEVGDGKHRFGLSMPLWALATGTGDCDTRAVLLASLARSGGLCEV
ncbi:MAG: hypothetical protein ACKOGJ_13490, partial [Phycisphaerales bacterium]